MEDRRHDGRYVILPSRAFLLERDASINNLTFFTGVSARKVLGPFVIVENDSQSSASLDTLSSTERGR